MEKMQLKLNIQNYLEGRNKKFFFLSNDEILEKIRFKFMRGFSECSESFEDIEIYENIQKIRFEKSLEGISYYSLRNFKNILYKRINVRFFYFEKGENLFDVYISYNLMDKRFRNEKFENVSKADMIKMKNRLFLKEKELRVS